MVKRPVRIGLRSDLEMQILDGLTPDDVIVLRPDTTMMEGQRVRPRSGR